MEKLTFFRVEISLTDQIEKSPISRTILTKASCNWDAMEKVASYFKNQGFIILDASVNTDRTYVGALFDDVFTEDENFSLEEALNRGD